MARANDVVLAVGQPLEKEDGCDEAVSIPPRARVFLFPVTIPRSERISLCLFGNYLSAERYPALPPAVVNGFLMHVQHAVKLLKRSGYSVIDAIRNAA